MNAYDNASIIVTPNAYKTSKLYALKPTDASADMTVVRATNATRINSAGLLETVGSHIARLNYPALGGCPAILIEPQRTNLFTYSSDFSNAFWRANQASVAADSTTSPDGTANADTLTEDNTTNNHYADTTAGFAVTSGNTYSFSVYAKDNGRYLSFYTNSGGFPNAIGAIFNLSAGTIHLTQANTTAYIEEHEDGWYRCVIIGTANASTTTNINFLLSNSLVTLAPSYAGDGTSGVYLFGAQMEVGSCHTSYIPTVAATVTRNADIISKTAISALIGQTEGTIYADINYTVCADDRFISYIGDASDWFQLELFEDDLYAITYVGTVNQGAIIKTGLTAGRYKIAFAYAANDLILYVNGVQVGTDTSASIPATAAVYLGANSAGAFPMNDEIRAFMVFKTRLSNAELVELTTI